jgi:hypothetical protein
LASLSRTSAAFGVLNAVFFKSGVTSSTPFIANNGQYSQSKLSVMNPDDASPLVIFCANARISSKLCGGPARPAFVNIGLL